MCESCGCGATEVSLTNLATGRRQILGEHPHTHADGTRHSHDHDHDHVHATSTRTPRLFRTDTSAAQTTRIHPSPLSS